MIFIVRRNEEILTQQFSAPKTAPFHIFLVPLPDKRGEKIILKNNLKFYVLGLGNQCVTP